MTIDRGFICRSTLTILALIGVSLLLWKSGDIWQLLGRTPPSVVEAGLFIFWAAVWLVVLVVPFYALNLGWRDRDWSVSAIFSVMWMVIIIGGWFLLFTTSQNPSNFVDGDNSRAATTAAWLFPIVIIYAANLFIIAFYETVARKACKVILGGKKT